MGRRRKINILEQCERWMSGQEFPHSPSQHSLTPQPQLRLPLHPQPQPRLHPLHPSGSYSKGGAVAVQKCEMFIIRGAVAHFEHKILIFSRGCGGSMDVRYYVIDLHCYDDGSTLLLRAWFSSAIWMIDQCSTLLCSTMLMWSVTLWLALFPPSAYCPVDMNSLLWNLFLHGYKYCNGYKYLASGYEYGSEWL